MDALTWCSGVLMNVLSSKLYMDALPWSSGILMNVLSSKSYMDALTRCSGVLMSVLSSKLYMDALTRCSGVLMNVLSSKSYMDALTWCSGVLMNVLSSKSYMDALTQFSGVLINVLSSKSYMDALTRCSGVLMNVLSSKSYMDALTRCSGVLMNVLSSKSYMDALTRCSGVRLYLVIEHLKRKAEVLNRYDLCPKRTYPHWKRQQRKRLQQEWSLGVTSEEVRAGHNKSYKHFTLCIRGFVFNGTSFHIGQDEGSIIEYTLGSLGNGKTTCEEHTIALALAQKPHHQTAGVSCTLTGPRGDLQPLLFTGSRCVYLCTRENQKGSQVLSGLGTSAGFFALISGQFISNSCDCVPMYQFRFLRGRLLKSHYPPVLEPRRRAAEGCDQVNLRTLSHDESEGGDSHDWKMKRKKKRYLQLSLFIFIDFGDIIYQTGEMLQWMKCLPHKYEEQNSDSKNPQKNLVGVVTYR
ncbi:hypothetical protein STEG23_036512 [Scotinomys teguina]